MITKIIVLVAMLLIVYSLGSGMYYLMADKSGSLGIAKALSWRVALSLALFVFLLLGYHFGLLQPNLMRP